jgi:hypothetical protein
MRFEGGKGWRGRKRMEREEKDGEGGKGWRGSKRSMREDR